MHTVAKHRDCAHADMVRKLIRTAEDRAGGRTRLAKQIGVRHSTILNWETGGQPTLDSFIALLDACDGADINRALPEYNPARDANRRDTNELTNARKLLNDYEQRLRSIARIVDLDRVHAPDPPSGAWILNDRGPDDT